MKKKSISIIVSIILIFEILFPEFVIYAEDSNQTNSSENINEGSKEVRWSGTDNPDMYRATFKLYRDKSDVRIESIEDLVDLSTNVSKGNSYEGKIILLTKTLDFESDGSYEDPTRIDYGDLNLDGKTQTIKEELTNKTTGRGFTPIGTDKKNPFSGIFYGETHEIRNIYIKNDIRSYQYEYGFGLFGILENSEIYDLTVTGEINSTANAAGIAGKISRSKIINCHSDIDINIMGNSYFGGIVAYAENSCEIKCCSNSGTINAISDDSEYDYLYIGGIVGMVGTPIKTSTAIEDCSNSGEINIKIKKASETFVVGGIVGKPARGTLDKCYNSGDIKVDTNEGEMNEYSVREVNIGGIAGDVDSYWEFIIQNCYNAGDIESTANKDGSAYPHLGGITGKNMGSVRYSDGIFNCGNTGNLKNNVPRGCIGGICGFGTDIYYRNCYNAGQINGVEGSGSYIGNINGFKTRNQNKITPRCYYRSTSKVVEEEYENAPIAISNMKSRDFVQTLNSNIDFFVNNNGAVKWIFLEGEYPMLDINMGNSEEITMTTSIEEVENVDTITVQGNGKATFENLEDNHYVIKEISAEKYNINTNEWQELIKGKDYVTTDYGKNIVNDLIFDLSLRKSITKVERRNQDITEAVVGKSRKPEIDLEGLKNGTTAYYIHPKETVNVKNGDIITYTIRIYNEGKVDGYANEITDYLPEGLEYIESQINKDNAWVYDADNNSISTKILSAENNKDNIIKAVDLDKSENFENNAKSLQVQLRVSDTTPAGKYLTNRAEITSYGYYESNDMSQWYEASEKGADRDSIEKTIIDSLDLDNWYTYIVENEKNVDMEKGTFFKAEQDDDDYETVAVEERKTVTNDGIIYEYDDALNIAIVIGLENDIINNEYLNIPEVVNVEGKNYKVIEIGSEALSGGGFSSINLPNSLERIEEKAFDKCDNLKDVIIPKNVSSLHLNAFSTHEVNITIDSENLYYYYTEGILYNKDSTILYGAMKTINVESFIVPDSVIEIKENAFKYYGKLQEIIIKKNVNIIHPSAFETVKDNLTIKGYTNSCAEEYAKENNIKFEKINTDFFIWQEDNYNFINSSSYFGGYYIGDDIYNCLLNTYKEEYNRWMNEHKEWKGSCAGMAISSMLLKYKYLTPQYWQEAKKETNNEYDLEFSSKLSYMINFYHVFQNYMRSHIYSRVDMIGQGEFEGFYNGVKNYYENNSSQLLLCDFFWKEGEETHGHSVVIIREPEILDDEFYKNHNATLAYYKYRIPIYDVNKREERYIYISENFEKLTFGSDTNIEGYGINADVASGASKIDTINAYELRNERVISIEDELQKNGNNVFETPKVIMNYNTGSAVKISNSDGKFIRIANKEINAENGNLNCEIFPVVGITSEKDGEVTENSVVLDKDDWYSIETENSMYKLNASMQFGESYMQTSAKAGGKAIFENKKAVTLSNYSGQEYEMKLTVNDEYMTLPWYTITASGTEAKEVKLEMVEKGVVVSGDNLNNLIIKGNNAEETVELKVSTDKDKVFVTANNDETKLVAYIDKDGDGNFETLLEEVEKTLVDDKEEIVEENDKKVSEDKKEEKESSDRDIEKGSSDKDIEKEPSNVNEEKNFVNEDKEKSETKEKTDDKTCNQEEKKEDVKDKQNKQDEKNVQTGDEVYYVIMVLLVTFITLIITEIIVCMKK